ncbi:RNA polymerase sigma factor [Vibrio chagasii]|jgi:RNA polymerase sigma-70 factor (ECF subfamily)|uniref:RNA polymerase sigma factor n=2 Tax=Vibrionaceae TaxID=641 RepID=A0A7V7NVK4_9VIBR|nr:sigma-70 family RNA polymerase sigma factor [Vibrio chagasii]NOI36866.1 sigma-70 family RNA polymerase sigma factor [Vibrio sp. 070316B]NOI87681.1 sigma-70 family RNA polymerase sigma factor [Vibrio sp. 99K-1]NOI96874.1 sigma-70 family RNA polymerase sigma factor [Vibrio sp. T3Y01]NOH34760.1 sigma-70 family RNA polymerase sigma factor [Vibrio chagasii]|eukprot:TRINITY_DN4765_c0_g1_i1.p1 TRINITY_DN4765_c0_g1~~TRINITY_DN4765_c0_g1_i1.p1  ORF type:complete len:192 (+),score=18.46 TRINITY_DN4765_c0_g1_i1:755-1330(+)
MEARVSIIKMFGKKKAKRPVNSDMDKQRKYEALVRAYHRDLFRYAYWLCKDKSIAEDLVQETCLRAWKSLDSLQDEKAAKSWLITILRRENARRFERKQFDLVDIDDHGNDASVSDDPHHQHQWLQVQIMKLEIDYREPLFLQVIGGFSGDEIADILDLNKNTVMTRLFRARNQLKEMLDTEEAERGQHNG